MLYKLHPFSALPLRLGDRKGYWLVKISHQQFFGDIRGNWLIVVVLEVLVQWLRLMLNIVMSHGKHMHQRYMRLCFTHVTWFPTIRKDNSCW